MRVLLVNAINYTVDVETSYPNLGLGYLAGALRYHFGKNTFDFKIIDKNVKNSISEFKPHILCITSVSQNYNIAKDYARIAKAYNIPVIVGGIHISMLPRSLSGDMDIGCLGEGEKTIVELFSLFLKKGEFFKEDLASVKGIVYRDGLNLVINPPREQIKDLDQIPLPERDLLKIDKHVYMFSSRGCPYDCVFCASANFWGRPRFFSAEYVVKEIEELVERFGAKIITFFDDLFIANLPRVKKIAEILEGKSFFTKIKFTCSARANLINEESAILLKRMRVFSVALGLESGSDKTLSYLKGGNITVGHNSRAIALLNKYKISPNAAFIIGAPHETKEDMLKTYFFIKNSPLCLFNNYVLTPFPGTPLWEYAKERNVVSDDMDWSKLNVNFNTNFNNAVILSELLERKDIIKMYRKFQRLRLFKNMKNVWFSPQLFDLPDVILKTVMEYFSRIFKKKADL